MAGQGVSVVWRKPTGKKKPQGKRVPIHLLLGVNLLVLVLNPVGVY